MASGSADGTCKIWNIAPLGLENSENVAKRLATMNAKLSGPISMFSDQWDEQKNNELEEIYIGEIEIEAENIVDLVFTFVHEAPVTAVTFTHGSE